MYFYVAGVYNSQTVSRPDRSRAFTLPVCALLTLPIPLHSHQTARRDPKRVNAPVCVHLPVHVICICVLPPHPSLCVCGSEYGSTVTSLADGMMAVITTFQRAPIGSIKAHWLSAEQGSRSSVQADACDKIMIRPLSGFHIDRLTTAYRCHHLTCPGPLLMTQQLTGPLEQWGLQENWVQGKKAPEYKVHLFNYSGM